MTVRTHTMMSALRGESIVYQGDGSSKRVGKSDELRMKKLDLFNRSQI